DLRRGTAGPVPDGDAQVRHGRRLREQTLLEGERHLPCALVLERLAERRVGAVQQRPQQTDVGRSQGRPVAARGGGHQGGGGAVHHDGEQHGTVGPGCRPGRGAGRDQLGRRRAGREDGVDRAPFVGGAGERTVGAEVAGVGRRQGGQALARGGGDPFGGERG